MNRPHAGFTLAESLIAIAIVSFTLLTIIGMMPPGLDHLKDAEDRAARSRIIASIAAQYEALDWEEIKKLGGAKQPIVKFDRQGLPTDENNALVYLAQAEVLPGNTAGETLPGTTPSAYLRRLQIKISDRPGAAIPFGTAKKDSYELRTVMLVRTQALGGALNE